GGDWPVAPHPVRHRAPDVCEGLLRLKILFDKRRGFGMALQGLTEKLVPFHDEDYVPEVPISGDRLHEEGEDASQELLGCHREVGVLALLLQWDQNGCHLLGRCGTCHVRCEVPGRAPNVQRVEDPYPLPETEAVEKAQEFRLWIVDECPLVGFPPDPDKDAC